LVNRIRGAEGLSWSQLLAVQYQFLLVESKTDAGLVGRYKQWLGMLTQGYPQAQALWDHIKRIKNLDEIRVCLQQQIELDR
jgi:tRNA-dihydrouridine synthase C